MLQRIRPIHPFPARMAPEIALDELPSSSQALRVLDPMTGSGTTLVAARLRGHKAIGFDRDPLAVLMAGAWVTSIDASHLLAKAGEVLQRSEERCGKLRLSSAYPPSADLETREFIEYWFDADNRKQLTALASAISGVRDQDTRNLLWCALSRLIVTKEAGVSLAMDVSHSRPHKAFTVAPLRAFEGFLPAMKRIVQRSPFLVGDHALPEASVSFGDARQLPLANGAVDIVITSPPYLNAIDYMRGHRLALVWMGHTVAELRKLRSTNVGTEVTTQFVDDEGSLEHVMHAMCTGDELDSGNEGMLRTYLRDLDQLLRECHRVLVPGGRCVVVIGDCNLRQTFVENSLAIELLGGNLGFTVESVRRRQLQENKRYLPPPGTSSSGGTLQKRMREEVVLTFTA